MSALSPALPDANQVPLDFDAQSIKSTPEPTGDIRFSPEALENMRPTQHWRQLKAAYAASNGDPAVRQAVLGMAGHLQIHLPELLELEPVPYTGPEAQSFACPGFAEDPCVCDSQGEPKGQCANCGDHEGQHVAPSVSVPVPQAEEPAPAAPEAKPLPAIGNPNCARVPFVDDKPAMEVVIAKRVTDSGFLDGVPAQVVAAIPESNGGGSQLVNIQNSVATAQPGVRMLMFDGHAVRTGGDPENPWVCVLDVLRALDDAPAPKKKYYVNKAVEGLDAEEWILNPLPDAQGVMQPTACVYESGLYFLIGKSRKASARKFQAWVRKEVLPSVNRTGGYGTQLAVRDDQLALALRDLGGTMAAITDRLMVVNTQVGHVEGRVTGIEARQARTDEQIAYLRVAVGSLAGQIIDGERRMQDRLGVRLPQLPAPAVESAPGLRMLVGEEYLTVEAYRRRFYPRGFEAGGLSINHVWVGRKASDLCLKRGLAMPERPLIANEYSGRCYPLSVLHEVANAHRRGTAGGDHQVALAA